MAIGTRVRVRRLALGLTQQDLANRTGIPQTLISRIEREVIINPGAEMLKRLARALGCSIDYLVDLYDAEPAPTPAGATPVGAA